MIIKCKHGWRYLDPLLSGLLDVKIDDVSADSLAHAYKNLGFIVVGGNRDNTSSIDRRKRPRTCVSFVKHFVGIKVPQIQTPYQLYKYLLKNELALKL